jgi:hypothetical protein
MTGIVGKLFDEKFVSDAEFVFRAVFEQKRLGAEMLDQITQHLVRKTVLVGPLGIAENAVESIGICLLD